MVPYIFVSIGVVFALFLIDSSRATTQENNFYTRFQACVLTVAPSVRNEASIDSCYDQVEQQTGVKADRYHPQGFHQ